MKNLLKNFDVKTLITFVALLLWVGFSVWGCYIGAFDSTFDFFKEVFLTIIAFYLGTQAKKREQEEQTDDK